MAFSIGFGNSLKEGFDKSVLFLIFVKVGRAILVGMSIISRALY
jgi:hypothetical protein